MSVSELPVGAQAEDSAQADDKGQAARRAVASMSGMPTVFANSCAVVFTAEEVFLHFGIRNLENPEEAEGAVRIVTTLPHAKRLAIALVETVLKHEEKLGEIRAAPALMDDPESDESSEE